MKKIIALTAFLIVLLLLPGCGSSTDTTNANTAKTDSLYVFDEIPMDTVAKSLEITPVTVPEPVPVVTQKKTLYFVQIGAFSTEDKAHEFIESAKKKLKKEFKVYFSQKLQLHVVQVIPAFATRQDAEAYRNDLWKIKEYKDAWITTSEE